MNSELHLIIIWHTARSQYESILNALKVPFKLLNVYEISWDKQHFIDNLVKFYSHSQFHLHPIRIRRMFNGKARHCGIGSFYLIVFQDNNPTYEDRDTSSGRRKVNINIFDLKQQFRDHTGGGHKIHATDSQKETNKDLTLLLGTNIDEFMDSHSTGWNGEICNIHRNVTGHGGYDSFEAFLKVLNSSLEYVILRNFENFPKEFRSKEHGDIDLLVSNIRLIRYLTGAKKVFKQRNRVHYKIRINDSDVPFDFRYIGDGYYDSKWESQILRNRILKDNLFYIPCESDYFYSLLYHAILHKPILSNSYKQKLQKESRQLISRTDPSSFEDTAYFRELDKYMIENNFRYVVPMDYSVYFNHRYFNKTDNIRITLLRKIKLRSIELRHSFARLINRIK